MATIAINISKNLRDKLGEEGVQEFVSILNPINTTQVEAMERLNGRTYEKFQQELTHNRELLASQIERSEERVRGEIVRVEERLRGETDKKNAELRANLIKWMFIFWSTTIITMVAGYLLK
ncbi:MAG: hypothetical protein ONB46_21535 [candidate division KSB1 bacterium]|nr:hypothetical protein [candidate division KSB1 bacterium]MDZ7368333.1 hypothetical protein [candidate division KSB1 bacterium]MDZ7403053.1 hypothetical protein [candidate division KSB1 bacterium]